MSLYYHNITTVCDSHFVVSKVRNSLAYKQYRHQEFQFPFWYAGHLVTESEHQILNGSHTFVSITWILFGQKYLVSSNICVKGYKIRRENNPIRLCHKRLGAYVLFHNVQCPTNETETLDACIHDNYYESLEP